VLTEENIKIHEKRYAKQKEEDVNNKVSGKEMYREVEERENEDGFFIS
jgi:hypothetical protein